MKLTKLACALLFSFAVLAVPATPTFARQGKPIPPHAPAFARQGKPIPPRNPAA